MDTIANFSAPEKAMPTNYFEGFRGLGYSQLVPVIPPDATVSEKSSLFKRIGTKQDGRGKTPGIKAGDGKWSSYDWIKRTADQRDFQRWHDMGAGVGLKTGNGIVAIDADTMNDAYAKIIKDIVDEMVGPTPIRIGNRPKAIYVVRCSGPVPYQRIDFGPNTAPPGTAPQFERVEILTEGKFFVAQGTHPKTNKPYTWPKPIVALDELPTLSPDQVTALLERLRKALPEASKVIKQGSGAAFSQQALRGHPEMVRKAVAAIPNTSALFPSRESYVEFGYAIKAAIPDNDAEAFDIYAEWCERWADGDNEPGVVASDWSRIHPPFRRGATWIYEQAELHGQGKFSSAEVWFTNLEEHPLDETPSAIFAALDEETDPVLDLEPTTFQVRPLAEIPRRQWIYGQHLIRGFVSTTVAPGGLGKSSLIIVEALAMASGKPLLGVTPRGTSRVWLWNGEDPADELERRVAAAMQLHGLQQADIGDRLLVDSGRNMEIVLARQMKGGAGIQRPVANALEAALKRREVDVMQIDPFISSHRVRESDNDDIDLVVKEWGRVAGRCNVAIELVHHVRKGNGQETTIEDARGAGALINAVRSARVLTRMTLQEAKSQGVPDDQYRRFFRFGADAKNNLAPLPSGASTKWFELKSIDFCNGDGDGLDAVMNGDSVGAVTLWSGASQRTAGNSDADQKALDDIAAGDFRVDVRSGGDWVGHPVAAALGLMLDDPAEKQEVNAWIKGMMKAGRLKQEMKMDKNRKSRAFMTVLPQPASEGLFG